MSRGDLLIAGYKVGIVLVVDVLCLALHYSIFKDLLL